MGVLQEMLTRNPNDLISFLIALKENEIQQNTEGIFLLLQELLEKNVLREEIKTRIFVHSISFYRKEMFDISDPLLKNCILTLTNKPNPSQVKGLANLVFQNNNESFSKFEEEIINLEKVNKQIITLMRATFTSANIDKEIISYIPCTLLILNSPFIQVLKEQGGMMLIRNIPNQCYQSLVLIFSLISAPDFPTLKTFISALGDIIIVNWDKLQEGTFTLLLNRLSEELHFRNKLWVKNIDKLLNLIKDIIELMVNRKLIIKEELILSCVNGDTEGLNSLLDVPMQLDDSLLQQREKIVHLFKTKNPKNNETRTFLEIKDSSLFESSEEVTELEKYLKYELHLVQKMFINFISSTEQRFSFIIFGIGNGKTLLSGVLGIQFALETGKPVFVISKFDHLVLRDQMKFQGMITSRGLQTNVNYFQKGAGVYFFSETQIIKKLKDPLFLKVWSKSKVIIDEVDWILFEGSQEHMRFAIEQFQLPK